MKCHPSKILFLPTCFFLLVQAWAQTNIGGTVNVYTDVTLVGPCANKVAVSNTSGFTAGNSVVLIQMQGATIDETASASFGTITAYNSSGFWEKAIIHSIAGNSVTFTKNLLNSYSTAGKVQMVLMPTYSSANVSSTLTGTAWNGTAGGVIAIEVTGTLTLNSNIDASGLGFRGGANTQVCPNNCNAFTNASAWYYPTTDYRGAYKGEGIAAAIASKEWGRGAQANGGGGGNDHNNGGGGGSNASSGGVGGNNAEPGAFNCKGGNNYGRNGNTLNYASLTRLFLGGGGGAGHGNNGGIGGCPAGPGSGAGGNGGGIVIIIANTLVGNGYSILSKGTSGGIGYGDGAGGGGAGGALFLSVPNYSGNLTIDLSGGNGGDAQVGGVNRCFGPGGGGGSGPVLSTISLPGTVTTQLIGGTAGFITTSTDGCNGTHSTATDGTNGTILTGATLRQSFSGPNSGCGLPVIFIHFTGRAVNKQIELKWATATEIDADYFSIERSTNQVDFYEIGRVPAAGNTSTRTDYSFMDGLPYPGINYYRIRQVDVTGFEKFTTVIAVNFAVNDLVKNIFPNPVQAGNHVQLSLTDPEKIHYIRLTDVAGRLMDRWERKRNPDPTEKLFIPEGLSGIYLLIVQTGEKTQVLKLVVE